MEVEKPHHLLSAYWRHRKASGIIQSKLRALRTRGGNGWNPSTGAGEHRCLSAMGRQEEKGQIPSSSACVFYSDPQQIAICQPTLGGGGGNLPY